MVGFLRLVSAFSLVKRGGANRPPDPTAGPPVAPCQPSHRGNFISTVSLAPPLTSRSPSLSFGRPYILFLSSCSSLATGTSYTHFRFCFTPHIAPSPFLLTPCLLPQPPGDQVPIDSRCCNILGPIHLAVAIFHHLVSRPQPSLLLSINSTVLDRASFTITTHSPSRLCSALSVLSLTVRTQRLPHYTL